MAIIRVPLSSRKYPGLFAIIDEEDAAVVMHHKWHPARSPRKTADDVFYAHARINGNHVSMHRLINRTPSGKHTDHINGNTLDNRRENLRTVEPSQNRANWHTPVRAERGYIGVEYHSGKPNPYRAVVRGASVGHFLTAEDAARQVDKYRRLIWGDHVRLNFPDEKLEFDGVVPGHAGDKPRVQPFRGVHWHSGVRRWRAAITVNGYRRWLGDFDFAEDAARAYDKACVELGRKPRNGFVSDVDDIENTG